MIAPTVADFLRLVGFEVHEADNGRTALDLSRIIRPELILIARDLPVLTGLDVVGQGPPRPQAVSGSGDRADRRGQRGDGRRPPSMPGATTSSVKPIGPDDLVSRIDRVLPRRTRPDAGQAASPNPAPHAPCDNWLGSAAVEHAFTGPAFTIGIEEELMILDAHSLELANAIESMLEPAAVGEIKPELMESVLEVSTDPCENTAQAGEQLRSLRGQVSRLAAAKGLAIGSAGTHPYAMWEDQRIVARPRYRDLISALRFVARQELIFGMHVHVAVDDPGQGDPRQQRDARPHAGAARALGELAVLAGRHHRARVDADADLPRLSRASGSRRPTRIGPTTSDGSSS